jgi:DNA-binding NarL/FixJ family response regulator
MIKLTPRESQILTLIQDRGVSNKIIAKMLHITESTVKLHITHIFKKYGVKNRTQLALFSKGNTEV